MVPTAGSARPGRTALSPRPDDRGLRRARHGPPLGRAAGIPGIRKRGAPGRAGPRRARALARRPLERSPLRGAHAPAQPGVRRSRRAVAGAGDRRQRGDLFRHQRGDAPLAPGRGAGSPRADLASRRRGPTPLRARPLLRAPLRTPRVHLGDSRAGDVAADGRHRRRRRSRQRRHGVGLLLRAPRRAPCDRTPADAGRRRAGAGDAGGRHQRWLLAPPLRGQSRRDRQNGDGPRPRLHHRRRDAAVVPEHEARPDAQSRISAPDHADRPTARVDELQHGHADGTAEARSGRRRDQRGGGDALSRIPAGGGRAGAREGSPGDSAAAGGREGRARRLQPVQLRVPAIAADPDGQRRSRAAARVREPLGTAARARGRAPARDRDPPGDRRRARPPDPAVPDRESAARVARCGHRPRDRGPALRPALRLVPQRTRGRHVCGTRLARGRVHQRDRCGGMRPGWPGPGAPGRTWRRHAGAQGRARAAPDGWGRRSWSRSCPSRWCCSSAPRSSSARS